MPRDARFRRLFKARQGHVILATDYAAMELRIGTVLAARAIADLHVRLSSGNETWFLKNVKRGAHHQGDLPYPEDPPDGTQPTPDWWASRIAWAANSVLRRRRQVMAFVLQRGLDPHLVTAVDFARRKGALGFSGHPLRWLSSLTSSDSQDLKERLAEERQAAKAANFGLLYGMSAKGLHASGVNNCGLDWTLEEASEARKTWFQLYPEFYLWHVWTKYCQSEKSSPDKWRVRGYGENKSTLIIPKFDVRLFRTTTLTGRPVAALDELNAALNYQAQGTGADILARAIADLPLEIAAMLLMPVHDELVFEVPAERVDAIRERVEGCIVQAATSVLGESIPIVVETSIGDTWSGD